MTNNGHTSKVFFCHFVHSVVTKPATFQKLLKKESFSVCIRRQLRGATIHLRRKTARGGKVRQACSSRLLIVICIICVFVICILCIFISGGRLQEGER